MNLFFERIKFNKILNFFQIRLEYPTKQNLVCFRGGVSSKETFSCKQCDQIGLFLNDIGDEFWLKKSIGDQFWLQKYPEL